MKRRAVFFDRDGVLVCAAPLVDYAHGPLTLEDFSLFPNISEPVQRLRDAGFLTVLATNQPAIARGQMSWETLNEMHRLLQAAVPLDDIEVCPHVDADNCACRKPKPGMLLDAARELGIDLGASFLVGDRWRDVAAAQAAGCRALFIDYKYQEKQPDRPYIAVKSLPEAAGYIVRADR